MVDNDHEPATFFVLNVRNERTETLKQVGERFHVSIGNGTPDPLDTSENLAMFKMQIYPVIFYYANRNVLLETKIRSEFTSPEMLVQLLGFETWTHTGQVWMKIGGDIFEFDEKSQSVTKQ